MSAPFDTLQLTRGFEAAGFPFDQASKMAEAVAQATIGAYLVKWFAGFLVVVVGLTLTGIGMATAVILDRPSAPMSASAAMSGYYYSGNTQPTLTIGSLTTPSADPAAIMAFEKHFSTTAGGYPTNLPYQHPTLYSACKLEAVGSDTNNNACRGMMGEAIDNVGGFGTFVEGGKFVGVGSDAVPDGTGGAWGVQAWAQSRNTQFTVGLEATVVKTGGSDAPGPSGFNPNNFAAGVVVSAGPTSAQKSIDVGYLINPFNAVKTSAGFACGQNTVEPTAGSCFTDFGGSAIGMNLSLGGTTAPHPIGAILISNNEPIVYKKTDNTITNVMYLGGDNRLYLGQSADTVVAQNLLVGGNLSVTPGAIAANQLSLQAHTVGSLPACNSAETGFVFFVTDANAPTYSSVLAGGSTTKVLALCDGTNWQAH